MAGIRLSSEVVPEYPHRDILVEKIVPVSADSIQERVIGEIFINLLLMRHPGYPQGRSDR
jgi:hypothetical protein